MFKHTTESIKETSEKRFISQADKAKYDGYNDRFRAKNDTYSKEELQGFMDELNTTYKPVEASLPKVDGAKKGHIQNIEIFGNTIQPPIETITLKPTMENGRLNRADGTNSDEEYRVRTVDYIEVQPRDLIDCSIMNGANVYFYDVNKKFIGVSLGDNNSTFVLSVYAPHNARYIRFYVNDSVEDRTLIIKRERFDKIESVGTYLGNGRYELKLLTRGVNLFNKNSDEILKGQKIMNPDGSTVVDEAYNVSHYIPVKGKVYFNDKGASVVAFYDNDKRLIRKENVLSNSYINTSNVEGCRYIRFNYAVHLENELQVEFGASGTTYKPYEECVESIILPCQLQKIGTYSDRLFIKDGRLYIDKFIDSITLNGTEPWELIQPGTENYIYQFKKDIKSIPNYLCMSDKYPCNEVVMANTNKGVYITTNLLRIRPEVEVPLNDFIADLKTNNVTVHYILSEGNEELIEVGENQQLLLSCFDEKTSVVFLTDVEGSIKCEVPVTTGAAVNSQTEAINTLLDEIENIEKLENNTSTTVESKSGELSLPKTNSGYISDILLEGKTLVNLYENCHRIDATNVYNEFIDDFTVAFKSKEEYTGSIGPSYVFRLPKEKLEVGKTYTLVFDSHTRDCNMAISCTTRSNNHIILNEIHHYRLRKSSITFTIPEEDFVYIGLRVMDNIPTSVRQLLFKNIMLFEGDVNKYTVTIPFKGLKSVENDICITSANNGNLIPEDIRYTYGAYLNWNNGCEVIHDTYAYSDFIRIDGLSKIKLVYCNRNTCFYREDKSFIPPMMDVTYTEGADDHAEGFIMNVPSDAKYIRVTVHENVADQNLCAIYDATSEMNDKYKAIECNSQSVLYKDANGEYKTPILRSVPDTRDTIEKHSNGKYYYHKRCGEIVLYGTESEWVEWRHVVEGSEDLTYNVYLNRNISIDPISFSGNTNLYCDKLCPEYYNFTQRRKSTIIQDNYRLHLSILKSELESESIDGVKKWLSNNNLTVVYPLPKEEVYECSQLDVISFEDETNISIRTNTVRPSFKATVRNDLNSVVKLISDKLNLLENSIKSDAIFENRMLLASTYSTDIIGLKSDISMGYRMNVYNEPDYDLYSLIMYNINVGEENYDVYNMEEIIDFYTMIGKLSYDMAEELLSMIIDDEPDFLFEVL